MKPRKPSENSGRRNPQPPRVGIKFMFSVNIRSMMTNMLSL